MAAGAVNEVAEQEKHGQGDGQHQGELGLTWDDVDLEQRQLHLRHQLHTTISTTMNVYSHVMPSLMQESADAMSRALGHPV
jgi:hypothetical protein